MSRRLTRSHPDARTRALVAAHAAAAKKGEDIVVLDVAEIISIIDCFVLVSVTNTRDATWVLLDYGDIVVHVFLEETRAYYDLDRLWGDAPREELEEPSVASK